MGTLHGKPFLALFGVDYDLGVNNDLGGWICYRRSFKV